MFVVDLTTAKRGVLEIATGITWDVHIKRAGMGIDMEWTWC